METVIVWFRRDLRLADNPAWARAASGGAAVVPVYIWAPEDAGDWAPGAASRWWLHHALEDLGAALGKHGLRLILRAGPSEGEILRLAEETGASAVYWNRCYESFRMRIDGRIKSRLKETGREAWSGNASLLREPWEVSTQSGGPYKVFTPYARACGKVRDRAPVEARGQPGMPDRWPESLSIGDLGLLPDIPWDSGLRESWTPTRAGGTGRLGAFLKSHGDSYARDRDSPAEDGTSGLSPYLHFGQLGPREVVAALSGRDQSKGLTAFYREIIWREFAYHVLYHFPDTPERPLQPRFEHFPWRREEAVLERWQSGQTGYPIVDAGMRQLWETGWMHNRIRMVVASFLVKHLLHNWYDGARWFWDTLVDADLASNTLGWQWAGGCGADAAPYFRIFNPMTQGEKFDSEGDYTRRYVPELRAVPDKYLFRPWELPAEVQRAVGCRIGEDYPAPLIDHRVGRERALEAFEQVKEATA